MKQSIDRRLAAAVTLCNVVEETGGPLVCSGWVRHRFSFSRKFGSCAHALPQQRV